MPTLVSCAQWLMRWYMPQFSRSHSGIETGSVLMGGMCLRVLLFYLFWKVRQWLFLVNMLCIEGICIVSSIGRLPAKKQETKYWALKRIFRRELLAHTGVIWPLCVTLWEPGLKQLRCLSSDSVHAIKHKLHFLQESNTLSGFCEVARLT